ncbi:uncharacterized protein LOC120914506 [Rana temporaria]|uniref:uncharacterized protein LOC120914506 n=1 Tax=Rana temporaria TaxID=8407 RepID=UPI001AAC55DC|nr:uncharacterized protein LOC120914506 [Rana temporaria]
MRKSFSQQLLSFQSQEWKKKKNTFPIVAIYKYIQCCKLSSFFISCKLEMERRAKLAAAAVLLGIGFTFSAFPCVSPARVYSPDRVIKRIAVLLTDLEIELKHLANDTKHFRVTGPTRAAWEEDIDCTGSFLDIFTNGTEAISGKFSDNSVTRISQRISKCVEHLKNTDCKELEHYHDDRCGKEVKNQTAMHFVKGFFEFCEAFRQREICEEPSRHKYDRRRGDWPERDHIC